MDFYASASALVVSLSLTVDGLDYTLRTIRRVALLYKLYGSPGAALFLFGNRSTWRLEAHILGGLKDEDALAFKKSVQGQCNMISVAVSSSQSYSTIHV